MIQLHLVRHGIAADHAGSDGSRALTGKGRKRFRRAARAFGKRAGKVDLILTSPLVRAVQTAEILAAEVKHGAVEVLDELAPGHAPAALLAAVAKRAGKSGSVALVGHDPQLTETLAALARVAAGKLDFKKGAIVRIDVSALPEGTAEPRWWIKPRGARQQGLPLEKPPAPATAAAPKKPAAKAVAKDEPAKPAKKAPAAKRKAPAATPKKAAPKATPPAKVKPAPKPKAPAAKATPAKAAPAKATPAKPPRAKAAPAKPAPAKAAPAAAPAPMAEPTPPAKPPAPEPPSVPQRFMGSPRPAGPPPAPPAAPPPSAAPAAPPPASPPEGASES